MGFHSLSQGHLKLLLDHITQRETFLTYSIVIDDVEFGSNRGFHNYIAQFDNPALNFRNRTVNFILVNIFLWFYVQQKYVIYAIIYTHTHTQTHSPSLSLIQTYTHAHMYVVCMCTKVCSDVSKTNFMLLMPTDTVRTQPVRRQQFKNIIFPHSSGLTVFGKLCR
jgi:hypothetical protein